MQVTDAAQAPAPESAEQAVPPAGAKATAVKKEKKAKMARDLDEIVQWILDLISNAPEPGCRRPYGIGNGFCNVTKQQTCVRPPSCKCPGLVDLVKLNITEKQVPVCTCAQCSAAQCGAVCCQRRVF